MTTTPSTPRPQRFSEVITGLLWLIGCQLVGGVIVRLLPVTVPGPVVGIAILFLLLCVRHPSDTPPIGRAADLLLGHLQLFFIPAGAGVIVYLSEIRRHALPIAASLLLSWLCGMVVVAAVSVGFQSRGREQR